MSVQSEGRNIEVPHRFPSQTNFILCDHRVPLRLRAYFLPQFSGRKDRTAAPACHISEFFIRLSSAVSFSW